MICFVGFSQWQGSKEKGRHEYVKSKALKSRKAWIWLIIAGEEHDERLDSTFATVNQSTFALFPTCSSTGSIRIAPRNHETNPKHAQCCTNGKETILLRKSCSCMSPTLQQPLCAGLPSWGHCIPLVQSQHGGSRPPLLQGTAGPEQALWAVPQWCLGRKGLFCFAEQCPASITCFQQAEGLRDVLLCIYGYVMAITLVPFLAIALMQPLSPLLVLPALCP